MKQVQIFRLALLLSLAIVTLSGIAAIAQNDVITPQQTIPLFNGKDLANFYTWVVDHKFKDPNRVFTVVDQVDGAPAIRISGENWGGLITQNRYANYRLIAEFRWGLSTWGSRKDRTKDSGILIHAQGPEGNYQKDFNGPWMRSVEFQIIEGGVGDFILVRGYEADGQTILPALTVRAGKDRDGENVYDPNGNPSEFRGGRINWFGRDPDWKDVLGFRGKQDVESPAGEWTRAEVICDGDKITHIVNGVIVNEGTNSSLTGGKILLQSEGAEIYFRRVDLEPLSK